MGLFSRRNDNAGYEQPNNYPMNTSGHQNNFGNNQNDGMMSQTYSGNTGRHNPLGSNQNNDMADQNFSGSTVRHNLVDGNQDAGRQNYAGKTGHPGALSSNHHDTGALGQNYTGNPGRQGALNSNHDTGALGQNYNAPSHQNTFGSNHSGGMTHHGAIDNNTGHDHYHYGRDAAVVGAGYEADKHHGDHQSANAGQNVGHGIFGNKHHDNTSGMNSTDHNDNHYGRDGAVAGAGYEADKHHRDHQNNNPGHSTGHSIFGIFGNHRNNGTVHPNTTSGTNHGLNNSNHHQDHHYGRDAGYEAEKHHNSKYNTTNNRRSGGGGGLSALFSRRDRSNNTNTTTHRRRNRSHSRSRRTPFDINSGHYNRRPSFGQWLKFTWLDILTMAILGALALGLNYAGPAPSRSFPVTFTSGDVVYPQFAYPLRHAIIPLYAAVLLSSLLPIATILAMQARVRSFWDASNATIGLLYALITAALVQVLLKWLIGGLSPHFLSVCAPVVPATTSQEFGTGLSFIMYDRAICSGDADQIDAALESFPNGASTAAFAGLEFLFLYLNAKLKLWSNHQPALWKLVAVFAPLLGAVLIAGSKTVDEYANWYDCVAGAVVGGVMALSAYRMVYASVWDFRFNHVPLTRHTPFSYGAGRAGAGGFESAVFSRAAGWGFEGAEGGAPGDAAYDLRGTGQGFNQGVDESGRGGLQGEGEKSGALLGGHHDRRDDGLGQQQGTMSTDALGRQGEYSRSNDGLAQHGVGSGMDSTGGKYHERRKSLGRKPVPGHQGVGMGQQELGGRDDIV